MSKLNYPLNCSTGVGNTGLPSCTINLEQLTGLLLTFDGFKIPAASLTDFDTMFAYLQAATLNADPLMRIYPLNIIEGLTDNTAAPEKKMSGYGNTKGIIEQTHQFEVELESHGIHFYKNLRKWNGKKNVRAYWVDKGFIGGYKDSNGDLQPMELDIFFKQVKVGNVADITKYMCEVELKDEKALTDNLDGMAIPDGFKVKNEIFGLTDVELSGTGGVLSATVTGVMAISKEDFISKFATGLAEVAWLVDGVSVSPTSISNGSALFTLTAGTHTIKLLNPYALTAEFIGSLTSGGYESNEITVTVNPT